MTNLDVFSCELFDWNATIDLARDFFHVSNENLEAQLVIRAHRSPRQYRRSTQLIEARALLSLHL
jgi:hypothetical protein